MFNKKPIVLLKELKKEIFINFKKKNSELLFFSLIFTIFSFKTIDEFFEVIEVIESHQEFHINESEIKFQRWDK